MQPLIFVHIEQSKHS